MGVLITHIQRSRRHSSAGGLITGPPPLVGCKDPLASNYNPNATVHDPLLCVYNPGTYERDPKKILATSVMDGGSLAGTFKKEVYEESYGFAITSAQSRFPGGKSALFEMRADSTVTVGSKGRSEIKINDQGLLTTTRKIGYSIFYPTGALFDSDISDYYAYTFQEHGWDQRTPPRGVFLKGNKMYYKINYGATASKIAPDGQEIWDLGTPPQGIWVDWVHDVGISYGPDGYANIYMSVIGADGVRRLYQIVKYKGPTGYNNAFMADYPKFGIYKRYWGIISKFQVYFDEIRLGTWDSDIRDVMPDPNLEIVYS